MSCICDKWVLFFGAESRDISLLLYLLLTVHKHDLLGLKNRRFFPVENDRKGKNGLYIYTVPVGEFFSSDKSSDIRYSDNIGLRKYIRQIQVSNFDYQYSEDQNFHVHARCPSIYLYPYWILSLCSRPTYLYPYWILTLQPPNLLVSILDIISATAPDPL